MLVVINDCFGGFGLSPLAVKRFAELNGKECYFFTSDFKSERYKKVTIEEASKTMFWSAYSVSNPEEYKLDERDEGGTYKTANKNSKKISLYYGDIKRDDENLIKVVKELGEKANGKCAELRIVEIPDGIEYVIDEYDGSESIHETHRTWG